MYKVMYDRHQLCLTIDILFNDIHLLNSFDFLKFSLWSEVVGGVRSVASFTNLLSFTIEFHIKGWN